MRAIEAKEVCKSFCCGFLYNREGRRNLEDVELEKSTIYDIEFDKLLTLVFKTARSISEITPT
jgi:hypothetical protein